MNTVKLSDNHLSVINKALETYYRLKSGQIKIAMDTAYDYALTYEEGEQVEKCIRAVLPQFKKLYTSGSSYGVGAKELGDANIAFEIQKTFEEFLAVKRNDGYYGHTVDFNGPLKVSGEPFPVVKDHKSYKDFPLNREQTNKILDLLDKKDPNKTWDYISTINLPKGEKSEITFGAFKGEEAMYGGSNTQVVIRVHKPQKS